MMASGDWDAAAQARVLAAIGAGWAPAETSFIGDWFVDRGLGGGRRAGSVKAVGSPGLPLEEAVAEAEARQRNWQQRPCFQIGPDNQELDALLDRRGYGKEGVSPVMAGPAETAMRAGSGRRMVLFVGTPLVALEEMWAAGGIGAARQAVMARTAPPKAVIMLREDDRVASAAFVAVHDGIATMSAVLTAPQFRRRGLGRETVAAAARFGMSCGAQTLALSVEADNEPAKALYAGLGLQQVSCYHYRMASEGASA